jgi:hypothetical protein
VSRGSEVSFSRLPVFLRLTRLDLLPYPTDKYDAYKARVRAAKPSDRAATEKKELEAVEREGLVAEKLAERGYGKAMMGVPKGKLE